MILQESPAPFGGKVTDIVTDGFKCVISTAKEGLFKSLSTMVAEVKENGGRPCAKIIYTPSIRKKERLQFHKLLVVGINESGENGFSLRGAIDIVVTELKKRGAIAEAINLA